MRTRSSRSGKALGRFERGCCVIREPLRLRVVVPSKVSRVFITDDAASVSGGLGLVGLKIAGQIENEPEVKSGPEKIHEKVDCSGREVVKLDADGKVIED